MVNGRIPAQQQVSWGLSGQWRSATSKINALVPTVSLNQQAYALINAYLGYAINKEMTIRLNLNNLGNKKYISSLVYESNYGAPRNAMLSFNYKL
jgi:outer membrane receptor for ferric coprogen and ferric-rhodotorulic acid